MSTRRGSYDVRTYVLQANVLQALPSAREYLIVSATVDISAIGFNMGDSNGDFEPWPFGFAIGMKEGTSKARIQSSINQTVLIAMVDGEVTVKDTRFAPGAGTLAVTEADGANVALGSRADTTATTDGGTFSLIALIKRLLTKTGITSDPYTGRFFVQGAAGSAFLNTVVVAAGTNVNGMVLTSCSMWCGAEPLASAQLVDSGGVWQQVMDSGNIAIGAPVSIPAGQQFSVSIQGRAVVTGTYRLL